MNINAECYGHAVIFNLKGELTEDSLDAFKQAVNHNVHEGKEVVDVVLNMENVPFVDSAAMEYLLDLQEQLATRLGQVKFAKCDDNIKKIMEITRLDAGFERFEDIAEAVRAIRA
jgi:anti-anti-sigma factor